MNVDNKQPLVTFALFAYNQEDYVREAIEAAFSQTYQPLEIILSDDQSSDRTFEIMQEMADEYEGPHKVIAQCNDSNLGIGAHVSKVVDQAKGDYIAFAAGDDISKPERVEYGISALRNFSGNRGRSSFLSTLAIIDQAGRVVSHSSAPGVGRFAERTGDVAQFGLGDLLNGTLHTSGPTRIIPKELHLVFGGIRADCFTEDIVYLFRSVLAGNVLFSTEETVLYRKHDANISAHESLYARPFDGVAQQLRSDLQTAVEKGLLVPDKAKAASDWIENNVALRAFYRKKLSGERPDFRNLVSVLKSPHLTIRRKFGMFREYMGIR